MDNKKLLDRFHGREICQSLADINPISKEHRYWWIKSDGKWYLCFKRKTIDGYIAIAGGYWHGFRYEEKVPAFKLQKGVKNGKWNSAV